MRGWLADPYLWDRRELMDHVPSLISRSLETRVPFDTDRALRQLGGQLRRNAGAGGLVRGYVALYGLGTASDELQRAAKACADRQRRDVRAARRVHPAHEPGGRDALGAPGQWSGWPSSACWIAARRSSTPTSCATTSSRR